MLRDDCGVFAMRCEISALELHIWIVKNARNVQSLDQQRAFGDIEHILCSGCLKFAEIALKPRADAALGRAIARPYL